MSKIPKRDGQKLNGIAPSVFALAFLLVGIPLASTYLISGAMYFGDEPIIASPTKSDVVLGPHPFYSQSGDGPDAKCDSAELTYSGANCTAGTTFWSPTRVLNYEDVWHHRLSGCANGDNAIATLNRYDCGDSGYVIHQNISNRILGDRTFPIISFNFTSQTVEECDWTSNSPIHGDSKVDYTIKIQHYKRPSMFWGTSTWAYGYVEDEVVVSDTMNFNNSFIESIGYSYPGNVPNYYSCKSKINVVHNYDFIDLDDLNGLLDEYKTNGTDSWGIFVTLELDNLRTKDGYSWSSRNFENPFWGDNTTWVEMYVDLVTYELNTMNTFIRFGVAGMGIGFWLIAIASTPYWDPFIKKMKGVKQ